MIVGNGFMKYGFDAYGDKVLKAEHMAYWMEDPQRTDPDGISFELGKDIEEVEEDFFDLVPTIKELYILNPECNVIMSDRSVELFKENNVLIRGEFDKAGERFAEKYGLRFLHTDVELACAGDYRDAGGVDTITVRFNEDGSSYIRQNNMCVGSSAGWSGGGEICFDLPKDFYITMDAAGIADRCWKSCSELIKTNGILEELMKTAKIKGGFLIDHSK